MKLEIISKYPREKTHATPLRLAWRLLLGVSAFALFCFGLYQLWKGMIG